jgi:hypothetical protein
MRGRPFAEHSGTGAVKKSKGKRALLARPGCGFHADIQIEEVEGITVERRSLWKKT